MIQSRIQQFPILPLSLAAGVGAVCHWLLLNFETALLSQAFIAFLTRVTVDQSSLFRWLLIHLAVNLSVGGLCGLLIKPPAPRAQTLQAGGAAVAIANSLCTFIGTVMVMNTLRLWLNQTGASLPPDLVNSFRLADQYLWAYAWAVAILTGLLVAPLGVVGAWLGNRFHPRRAR